MSVQDAALDGSHLANLVDGLSLARAEEAFVETMSRFAKSIGFRWFSYVDLGSRQRILFSYPAEWRNRYVERNYYDIDPVLRTAARGQTKFAWTAELARDKTERALFDEAAQFGILGGITVPVRGKFGANAAVTFAGGEADRPDLMEPLDCGLLDKAALYFHIHLNVVLDALPVRPGKPLLSSRERVCLTWIAQGKTLSETATILGISISTMDYHVARIRRRLGAATLPHAVSIALGLREIVL